MNTLRIGQVSERTGVGVETIRYYEREGLIPPPPRRASGYRQYRPDTIDRLRFIRKARALGFTLAEIGELLSLRVDPRATCGDVLERTEAKIDEIEAKIRDLQRIKRTLKKISAACDGQSPTSECPILDALGKENRR